MRPDIPTRFTQLWSSRWVEGAYRLRFELGGEDYDPRERAVPRALQAFIRAKAVTDALFGDACIGVLATYRLDDELDSRDSPLRNVDHKVHRAEGLAGLQAMGFRGIAQSSWTSALFAEEDGDSWLLQSFDLTGLSGDRNILLWNPIVVEMPISPSSSGRCFLLHPTDAVLLHVYDDRGMDVIGSNAESLRFIYDNFHDWLVDADRSRMQQLFA
jgi:hypothetical protein